jgi:DNA-binding transcriptional ArsR family regulator
MNDRSNVVATLDGDSCAAPVVDAERVAAVRKVLPADEMSALLEGGEMCVCDLAAATGQSMSAASHALRLLRVHRVVTVRRAGRMAYYRLADSHVRMLFDLAIAHMGHPDGERGDG